MKKKIVFSFILLFSLFFIVGCGKQNDNELNNDNIDNKIEANGNSVVLYFSATGTTKRVAERIAVQSNSDIIEIVPKIEYTSDDLNYNSDCRANREQNDSNARPEIKNAIDISSYDIIYLGYPIWWGTNPKIILTLLDTYDFTNKTIIPFCTSGSTGITKSVNDLRIYNSSLNIKDGKRFSINDSDEVINYFITSNKEEVFNTMKAIINGKEYEIILENNETVKAFINMLPKELVMKELNGNEKYVRLDSSLPIDSYYPGHINSGDVMLYENNCLVIFYESFDTTYSYTKIGHIDNLPDVGKNSLTVRFEK